MSRAYREYQSQGNSAYSSPRHIAIYCLSYDFPCTHWIKHWHMDMVVVYLLKFCEAALGEQLFVQYIP